MALSNGHSETGEGHTVPAQYLGKRKRTVSTEPDVRLQNGIVVSQEDLEEALQIIKRHDPTASIIQHPLNLREQEVRTTKRLRSNTEDREADNIESRISNGTYQTMEGLLHDIKQIRSQVTMESHEANSDATTSPNILERIDALLKDLSNNPPPATDESPSTPSKINGDVSLKTESPSRPSGEVLSLRSQTEHGIRQLFSGLPVRMDSMKSTGQKLPNGFEFAEVLNLTKNDLQGKDRRKFGEVFAIPRNAKTLEMPRASRGSRENVLPFIKPYENVPNSSRNDFKFTSLTTGSWLRYDVPEKSREDTKTTNQEADMKDSTLFKAVFSTFAPSSDNSQSAIAASDRSQHWFKRCTVPSSMRALSLKSTQSELSQKEDDLDLVSDQDLEEMIANYIPEDDDEASETEKVLDEISDLINTLSSYQTIRNLGVARGPSSASNPSKDEQNTYELLRTQIQLLVSTLPPFAVAKLNGDQLEELNISTHILVEPPEFMGTAQVDEYTMRRNRAVQAATSAAVRNPAPITNRTSYSTPASAYNAQARAYNNVPASAYGTRPPAVMYNTPRPATNVQVGAYPQSQYRPTGPPIHTPSVQQFQRPVTNGYGATPTPTSHSPYIQRPSQPGYQQRAQDSLAYSRPDAAVKPLTNGDLSQYQPRQYSGSNQSIPNNVSNTGGHQYTMTEAVKQRQASDTPQPSTEVPEGISTS